MSRCCRRLVPPVNRITSVAPSRPRYTRYPGPQSIRHSCTSSPTDLMLARFPARAGSAQSIPLPRPSYRGPRTILRTGFGRRRQDSSAARSKPKVTHVLPNVKRPALNKAAAQTYSPPDHNGTPAHRCHAPEPTHNPPMSSPAKPSVCNAQQAANFLRSPVHHENCASPRPRNQPCPLSDNPQPSHPKDSHPHRSAPPATNAPASSRP